MATDLIKLSTGKKGNGIAVRDKLKKLFSLDRDQEENENADGGAEASDQREIVIIICCEKETIRKAAPSSLS